MKHFINLESEGEEVGPSSPLFHEGIVAADEFGETINDAMPEEEADYADLDVDAIVSEGEALWGREDWDAHSCASLPLPPAWDDAPAWQDSPDRCSPDSPVRWSPESPPAIVYHPLTVQIGGCPNIRPSIDLDDTLNELTQLFQFRAVVASMFGPILWTPKAQMRADAQLLAILMQILFNNVESK